MDPATAATLIGVLGSALIGVLAGAFHMLRSDIQRVEGKLDSLVLALARAGYLTDPQTPEPPADSTADLGRLGLEG